MASPSSAFRFPMRDGGTVETGCTGIFVALGLITEGYKSLLFLNDRYPAKNKTERKTNFILQFDLGIWIRLTNQQPK